ncbi:MAG: hypothetical protein HDT38_05995 [Clostridiales bacterium]|nr:hypothetical protein [Clostridiales bacterium]
MKSEKLSPRQLAVAVMVGGMSAGASAAGRADWRWLLLAAALGVAAGWLLLRRVGNRPLHPVLKGIYCIWAVPLMADALTRTAGRIQQGMGGRGGTGWLLVLLAVPLLWMGWGKAAAFFRAAEILWLGVLAAVAAILLLGAPRMDWRWALEPAGGWRESLAAGTVIMSTGLFVLPYLHKAEGRTEGGRRGLVWLGALGVLSAALAALTAGLLSPAVAAELDGPFFAAAGLLGDSARLEGLVSALWLLPDLTLIGLLARTWGERRWPALAVAGALALSLTGIMGALPPAALPLGCLALATLTAALPPGAEK